MWPKTRRVLKMIGRGSLLLVECLLLIVWMGIKVVFVMVCTLIALVSVGGHFVGGPRG